MPFIDWSDSEEMVGLLIEYIADEKHGQQGDLKRRSFLSGLIEELTELNDRYAPEFNSEAIDQLRTIYNSIDSEFQQDPVTVHVKDCIEELEKLKRSRN